MVIGCKYTEDVRLLITYENYCKFPDDYFLGMLYAICISSVCKNIHQEDLWGMDYTLYLLVSCGSKKR